MLPKNNEIRIEPTTFCNYRCLFCFNKCLQRKKETMSFDLFSNCIEKIISKTEQYDTLTFAGIGDPLCDDNLEDKIKAASFSFRKTLVITNALELSVERFKRLQDSGIYSIRVSFHGSTPESYSKNHGVKEELYYLVKNQVERILNLKGRVAKILLTNIVVPGVNDSDYEIDLFKRMWLNKADMVEIWRVHNWIDGFNFRKLQDKRRNTCGRIFNGPLQIQVDGTVNACCFDYNGKIVFGDLKTQTLDEIFNSKEYLSVKEHHLSGIYDDIACKNCDQRNEDRTESLIFSSKYEDLKDRVERTSTAYSQVK